MCNKKMEEVLDTELFGYDNNLRDFLKDNLIALLDLGEIYSSKYTTYGCDSWSWQVAKLFHKLNNKICIFPDNPEDDEDYSVNWDEFRKTGAIVVEYIFNKRCRCKEV